MSVPSSVKLTCDYCGVEFTHTPPPSGGRRPGTCSRLCWNAHRVAQAKDYRIIRPRISRVCGSPLGSVAVPR